MTETILRFGIMFITFAVPAIVAITSRMIMSRLDANRGLMGQIHDSVNSEAAAARAALEKLNSEQLIKAVSAAAAAAPVTLEILEHVALIADRQNHVMVNQEMMIREIEVLKAGLDVSKEDRARINSKLDNITCQAKPDVTP